MADSRPLLPLEYLDMTFFLWGALPYIDKNLGFSIGTMFSSPSSFSSILILYFYWITYGLLLFYYNGLTNLSFVFTIGYDFPF